MVELAGGGSVAVAVGVAVTRDIYIYILFCSSFFFLNFLMFFFGVGATIRTCKDIQNLPYAGFQVLYFRSQAC